MKHNTEEKLLIDGPAGALELLVTRTEQARAVAVICHPHPLHGGTILRSEFCDCFLATSSGKVFFGSSALRSLGDFFTD